MSFVNDNIGKMLRVSKFSVGDHYTVTGTAENSSNVLTKLVQLAGRYCGRYASDLIYNVSDLVHAIRDVEKFDRVLEFCEDGVRASDARLDLIRDTLSSDTIQAWRLCYVPISQTIYLYRVNKMEFSWLEQHTHHTCKWEDAESKIHTMEEFEEEYERQIWQGERTPYEREFQWWLLDQTKNMKAVE